MAGVLKYTLIRLHPDSGVATALIEGKPVPDWATDLVETDDIVGGKAPAADAAKGGTEGPYAGLKAADLKAEIAKRNDGREEAAKISAKGAIAVLVAALEADDAAKGGTEGAAGDDDNDDSDDGADAGTASDDDN